MNKPETPPISQDILREAADWFVRISDETSTSEDQAALEQWLTKRPDHLQAWNYVQSVAGRFQQANDHAGRDGSRKILDDAKVDRSRRKALLTGGLGCIALALGWRYTPLGNFGEELTATMIADHSTRTGKIEQLALPDGSQVWLNTASAINLNYKKTRLIELYRGEIFVQTAHDNLNRPLIVTTSHGHLTALGTRFSVQQTSESTLLAVFEGAVRIYTRDGNEQIIEAGQQVNFNRQSIQKPKPVQRAREAWTKGILYADNIKLKEFVSELSNYTHSHITVSEQVADIKLDGAYPIDRPQHALKMLEKSLPIKVSQPYPWWTEIKPR